MQILETRLDLHDKWRQSVQIKINGRWRTARRKFAVHPCSCGGADLEFILVEEADWQGMSEQELEAHFPGIPWWAIKPNSVFRHCKACGHFRDTNYAYKVPYGGDYSRNGWYARQYAGAT